MKTANYFKQFLPAVAALTLVGTVSSCRDNDFDWDDAHANTAYEKFSDTFIKEFGKPADGHQWGFDMLWTKTGNSVATRSIDYLGNGTGRIVKLETGATPDEWKIAEQYGTAPVITDQEHKDVYAWFSAHKVTWDNTTEKVGNIRDTEYNYKFYDAPTGGNQITNVYTNLVINNGRVEKYNKSTNELIRTVSGKICINGGGTDGAIVKLVSFDPSSPTNTRNANGGTAKLVAGGSTLLENTTLKSEYKTTEDWPVGMEVNFNYAWIQHVASTKYTNGKDELGQGYDEQSVCANNVNDYTNYDSGNMNYLELFGTDLNHSQSKDYNKGEGPGYGWTTNPAQLMGILALGVDFNQLSYLNSSDGNLYHDKWYVVYLEGGTGDQKYAGWYLGFDLEGSKEIDASAQYSANGICNDWIIKLSAVNGAESSDPLRIMCEDLGGENNRVTIGNSKVHISDIDYNDIVLDVEPNTTTRTCKLTLRAAGGTLPLTVWYGETCLFETHELLNGKSKNYSNCRLPESGYEVMYNTGEGTDEKTAQSVVLKFDKGYDGKPTNSADSNEFHFDKYNNGKETSFDLNKLYFKVCRFDVSEYLASSNNDYSDAMWVNIHNIAGQAPLKLCVPLYTDEAKTQQVKWLKERHSIKDGYPAFVDWVKDPSDFFWQSGKTINSSHLY